MNATVKNNAKTPARKKQRAYAAPAGTAGMVMEEPLEYTVSCPVCERRAFDISELPETPIKVRLKCPHCHKIVQVPVLPDTT
jgi:Zn finger protein HypA/HybF involved in hydrogenase expression